MAIFKFRDMNLGKRLVSSLWSGIRCGRRGKGKKDLTKPYELYERLPSWYELYVEFTNRTTWHGLKYPCLPSRYKLRQVIWAILLLVNAGLFLFIMSLNMIKLNSYPISVNVEVDYTDEVPFPAITICNQNLYRLTAMQENGLYDYLVNGFENGTSDYCDDFQLYLGVCRIPDSFRLPSDVTGTGSVIVYGEMTRRACQALCVSVNDVTCSGFLYDRRARTCEISPYTGEWLESEEQVVTQCNGSRPVEFYRRIRCNTNVTIRCDFEDSSCPLRNDTSEKDQWMIVEAQGHPVLRDNTLNLESGHILNLLLTDRRPGYKSRLRSPYMSTTGKCLELFYWLQKGEGSGSEYPTLSVIQVTEEKDEVTISTTRKGPGDWSRLFVRLRSGIHQVVIEGKRGSVGMSGISVDDIAIMDCVHFSSHRDCKVTRLGRGYTGTQSVSADGHRCLPWESINSPVVARLPDLSPKAAGSYCRNIPMENWNSPSCFVELASGNIQLSPCDIPYCECMNASYFRCDNGMCLPPNLLCNGIDDCLDNSDELRACSHQRMVECKFTDDYKCGYTTTSIGDQRWTRLSSSSLAYYNGNLPRHSVDALEQLMVIDSKLGQFGDQVQLVSPLWNFTQPTLLELTYLMMASAQEQTAVGFYLYQMSDLYSPVRRLFNATSFDDTDLRKSTVCVPSGTYRLMFLGVQGVPYESLFGLDIVAIKGTCNATFAPSDDSFNCAFINFCGYRFLSSSSLFTRTLTNSQNAFDTTINSSIADKCSSNLTGIEGTILSPGYPGNYPNNLSYCEYKIEEPNGTTINITFIEFKVELDNDCLADRLEITDVMAGSTRIYCGNSIPPVFKSKGNVVRIVFRTDDTVNSGRFKLAYTTRYYSQNADDYIAVMKYTGPPPANFYSHWARLISPPIVLATNSCLSIRLVANANITIRKAFLNEDGIYSERRLFASALPLGQEWQHIFLNLAPSVGRKEFAVVLETAISQSGIVAAAVSDISLHEGGCRQLVTNGSFECQFSQPEQCGYLDESTGSVNWARVYDKISNQYYMRAVFTKSSLDEAVLSSVSLTVNSKQCLRLNLYSSLSKVFVSISRKRAANGLPDTLPNERYRPPSGIGHIYYELPVGTYSLGINVSYPVEVIEDSANDFDEVRIYGTIVTNGACEKSASDYKVSVTCNFDDDFACEYQPQSSFADPWKWVNFRSFLELNMHVREDVLNASLAHGNVMLFNGSRVNPRKGVLVSPTTTVSSPGQRMTLSVYASTNRSASLEIYITSPMGHVSRRLPATNSLLDNDWQVLSLCLPSGSYEVMFVAHTTPGNYVAIDDVVVGNASCSAAETDSHDAVSHFTWSPQFVWRNVPDIRNGTISPAENECVYVFYEFQGTVSYNESVKTSSNASECDIYIRAIGKFTTSLSFFDSVLNCTRQYVQIWRYQNGQLTDDGKHWCGELLDSALVPLRFTTEDILQIHVHAIEGNPRFSMKYSYEPADRKGYALALYYNDTTSVGDVTLSRVAEWVSPVIPTRANDTICLSMELTLSEFSSVEVLLLEREALTKQVTKSVVLTTSGARGDSWRRGVLEMALKAQTSRAQLVFYFSVSNATYNQSSGRALVAALRNVDVYNGSCFSAECGAASLGRCQFRADDSCGFVDTSVNTSRWIIASERSLQPTSGSCKVTTDNDYSYTGDVNRTISGRRCQRWDSQSPQTHHQDMADYFPDASLNDAAYFCRNPSNPFIARTAWCYTTEPDQRREYCDIPQCLNHFMRVEFPSRITSRAILTSPTFAVGDVMCLRFSYSLTSTRVRLTVYVTSASNDDIRRTYVIDAEPTSDTWLTGEVELTPTTSQVVFYADKTDVTDTSAFVSIDNVTMTKGRCQMSEEGNSSTSSSRVPYRGPRLNFTEYKRFILSEFKDVDMRNVTSVLAHRIDDLFNQCEYVVDDCLQAGSFRTEFTDMGQCYTFNHDQLNSYKTNATGAKSGLRLTLNIEQYEHVPEFGLGVGVKLYLHDQLEIPTMKNLGLSVPVAMHTLVSTSNTQTENLSPPYGKCGSANLSYYGSEFTDADYTEAKCLLQDKTAYYETVCECKDIYMPGPSSVCSLESYFDCVYRFIQDHEVPYTTDCPQACVTNTFSVELSQAQLPALDVKKLHPGKVADIERGYLHALEIRSRVNEPLIQGTLSQLQAVIDSETLLRSYVYFAALDQATSLPGHVEAAVRLSAQLVWNEIAQTGASLVSRFSTEYTKLLKPSVTYFVANVRSLYTQLSFWRDVLNSIKAAGWSRPRSWYLTLLNETWTSLARMNDTLVIFGPNIDPKNDYLPKLFSHAACNSAMRTLEANVDVLIRDFPGFMTVVAANPESFNWTSTAEHAVRIDALLEVLSTVENCSQQYEELLSEFRSWIGQLKFTAKNASQMKADDIMVMLNDIDLWLVELRDNYSKDAIPKKELATVLLGDKTADALQRIDNMIQEIGQQVVSPMQNRIDADESTAAASYLEFLQFLTRMFNFTRNQEIEEIARRLQIWREPVHNLEIPETMEYRLGEDEVWQVWPRDQDLETFVAESALLRLDLICRQYFDPLHWKLTFFLSEISNRRSQLQQAMTELLETLQRFLESTKLDESFVMKNFLMIDIYYGELKYEHITQSEGYSWQGFFSDLGSFFGLLMGCSILTMFEVIDLVVYYSIVKLIERYEERPLRQEVIDIKI